jgi:hypothetical protein
MGVAMSAVRISFLELSPHDASIAAQELRQLLLQMGIEDGEVKLLRTDPNAQNLVDALSVADVEFTMCLSFLAMQVMTGVTNAAGSDIWNGAKAQAGKAWQYLGGIVPFFRGSRKAEVTFPDGSTFVLGNSPALDMTARTGKLGVVLLGASKFPFYPADRKLDNPAFAKSAVLMRQLLSPQHTVFRSTVLLDFFDKDSDATKLLDEIDEKIAKDPEISDVVVYYCGHGHSHSGGPSLLMLRNTREDYESFTALDPVKFFGHIGKGPVGNKRCYFILDCCFAASAILPILPKAVRRSGGEPAEASRGTSFLVAAESSEVARADGSRGATMFTGALADVLLRPVAEPKALSLSDLYDLVWTELEGKKNAPKPRWVSPDQPEGDIALLPVFLRSVTKPVAALRETGNLKTVQRGIKQVTEENVIPWEDAMRGGLHQPVSSAPGVDAQFRISPVPPDLAKRLERLKPSDDGKGAGDPSKAFREELSSVQREILETATATDHERLEKYNGIRWHIARDLKQYGPLTEIEMRTFVALGFLRNTDLVWRPGISEWVCSAGIFPEAFLPAGAEPVAKVSEPAAKTSKSDLGEEQQSYEVLRRMAFEGDAGAMFRLAEMHETGTAVQKKDARSAARLYAMAGKMGNAKAYCNLGKMFEIGRGVKMDLHEAVRLYRQAIEGGDTDAMLLLAKIYDGGKGIDADETEAVRLYHAAAERENAEAQWRLALMYFYGSGVKEDRSEARRLCRLAAKNGHAGAVSWLDTGPK